MSKEQSYQNAASELLRLVGGKENVISAAHCATRLRLVLKDESKADVDGILKTELVKGQFSTGGQFQIIIGSGTVDEVYKYFIQYADIKESTKNEVKKAADQKMNPLQKLVKMLADVFVPIIPALVASGLLMGLNNVLTAEGLFVSGKSLVEVYPNIADLASMINTFASAAYAFLPILVGFSATKMFGGNPYLGAVMGMIMVSGDLLNAYSYGTAITEGTVPVWHIGALTIEKVGYQGTSGTCSGSNPCIYREETSQSSSGISGQPPDTCTFRTRNSIPYIYSGRWSDAYSRRLDYKWYSVAP